MGRGVHTGVGTSFKSGDLVCNYQGQLLSLGEGIRIMNTTGSVYVYLGPTFSIDASTDNGSFGRYINHSRNGNLTARLLPRRGIGFFANCRIPEMTEILFDYGYRSKHAQPFILHYYGRPRIIQNGRPLTDPEPLRYPVSKQLLRAENLESSSVQHNDKLILNRQR
jgi:hypothetical protein